MYSTPCPPGSYGPLCQVCARLRAFACAECSDVSVVPELRAWVWPQCGAPVQPVLRHWSWCVRGVRRRDTCCWTCHVPGACRRVSNISKCIREAPQGELEGTQRAV